MTTTTTTPPPNRTTRDPLRAAVRRASTTRSCGSASGAGCARVAATSSRGRAAARVETRQRHRTEPAPLPRRSRRAHPRRARRRHARAAGRRPSVAANRTRAPSSTRPPSGSPFDDGSVDTVVSTLVLCTVDQPASPSTRSRACSDRTGAAVPRARTGRRRVAGLAGRTASRAVAAIRRRLPLQPGDRGADRRQPASPLARQRGAVARQCRRSSNRSSTAPRELRSTRKPSGRPPPGVRSRPRRDVGRLRGALAG